MKGGSKNSDFSIDQSFVPDDLNFEMRVPPNKSSNFNQFFCVPKTRNGHISVYDDLKNFDLKRPGTWKNSIIKNKHLFSCKCKGTSEENCSMNDALKIAANFFWHTTWEKLISNGGRNRPPVGRG